MKTNQKMTVQIGHFGTLKIGHLSQMGDVSQVIEMGNKIRESRGLNPISLEDILKKQELWEFIIARNTQILRKSKSSDSEYLENIDVTAVYSDYRELKKFKTIKGEIQYGELIKMFPHLIKSRRGKGGGTQAELYILLKIASMLDKDLEVEIYDVFIQSKILMWRDVGGDNYIEFNKIVDTLPDRADKDNTSIYMQMARIVRKKLGIEDTEGYNEKEHSPEVQEARAKLLSDLTLVVRIGLIKTYDQLKEVIAKI